MHGAAAISCDPNVSPSKATPRGLEPGRDSPFRKQRGKGGATQNWELQGRSNLYFCPSASYPPSFLNIRLIRVREIGRQTERALSRLRVRWPSAAEAGIRVAAHAARLYAVPLPKARTPAGAAGAALATASLFESDVRFFNSASPSFRMTSVSGCWEDRGRTGPFPASARGGLSG